MSDPSNADEYRHRFGMVVNARGRPVRIAYAGDDLVIKRIPEDREGFCEFYSPGGRKLAEMFVTPAGELCIEFTDAGGVLLPSAN